MGVPQVYRKVGEQSIVSFDFVDFAAGTGYKSFYAQKATLSGSTLYFLSSNPVDSSSASRNTDVALTTGWTELINLDFDVSFNNPVQIEGKVLVSLNMTLGNNSSGKTSEAYFIVNIYKYDGTTETLLGTATIPTRSVTGIVVIQSFNNLIPITVSKTYFDIGEMLRLNVIGYGTITSASAGTFRLYHDAAELLTSANDSDAVASSTALRMDVPFRIDI